MRYEFKLPDLAEGMIEGEIVSWLVASGDAVRAEQPMVEVMTDKATVVIPSPHEGKVLELAYEAGDIAEVGTTLFILDVDGLAQAPDEKEPSPRRPQTGGRTSGPALSFPRGETGDALSARTSGQTVGAQRVPRGAGKVLATPATRQFARELGVDINRVAGSGPAGRVTKDDVRAALTAAETAEGLSLSGTPAPPHTDISAAPNPPGAAAAAPAAPLASPAAAYRYEAPGAQPGESPEERVKLRGLRRAIYETMTRSTSTAAHFTYVDEVDCENLVAARARLKGAAAERGVRLTYLPFVAKASLLALRKFPKVNATMDDAASELVLKRYYHLGVAAATTAGLTVPVVHHADTLALIDLAGHIQALGERARDNTLAPSELKGSTFTITSLGKLGGLFATPIINHPEVAILGVHEMSLRAVVRDGAIVARQMMNISLSFDHRVIDGHEGAAFASEVKRYLEDPELMLLEMT